MKIANAVQPQDILSYRISSADFSSSLTALGRGCVRLRDGIRDRMEYGSGDCVEIGAEEGGNALSRTR